MKSKQLIAGIDVSKDTLDIYFNDANGAEHYLKVNNDAIGHHFIIEKLSLDRTYVMESSGPYYLKLAFIIKSSGGDIRVENPVVIKRFIQMNLERNKSDKKDAKWLYRYACQHQTMEWKLPEKEQFYCTQIIGSIDLYKRQLVMVENQLHSLDQLPLKSKEVAKSLKQLQVKLKVELIKLERELEQQLETWQATQLNNLKTIPGLGKRAVALLIVYTNGFKKISNYRQLIALTGLAPTEHTSGTSVRGKKGICKMGNGHLRSVLYMCSLSAIKHNKACKDLYARLKAKGKNGKVALIAVCNKLLKQAFAIATKGTTYQPNYKSSLN